VAALVDGISPDGISLQLVNLHPSRPRRVIIRAGAFGEHRFTRVRQGGKERPVNRAYLEVRLGPGAAGRLEIGMKLYVNRPSYILPWHGKE